MGKKITVRHELGLTQSAMADLLHIKRSQWSMYESGKRSLPTAAMVRLAEIELGLQAATRKGSPDLPADVGREVKKQLEAKLSENQFQLALATRKWDAAKEKSGQAVKAQLLTAHVKKQAKAGETATKLVKKLDGVNANPLLVKAEMARLEVEWLQQEALWLGAELKKQKVTF
ncbi:helix-turn-helix domain-containing protein [Flavobacterium sp. XGLA_31]|uniref:helix-turn-helix domain-containing protein n=1 Tax=Flavobacterium sp. XGLA_31 TaxID=3447666 RepID=UPI003F3795EF